jgi:prevent-host-death family protein
MDIARPASAVAEPGHEYPAAKARARFSALLDRAAAGAAIVTTRHGKPVAQPTPVWDAKIAPAIQIADILRIVELARTLASRTYDASYMDFARRLGLPIASAYKTIRRAVAALGVTRIGTAG